MLVNNDKVDNKRFSHIYFDWESGWDDDFDDGGVGED